MDSEATMALFKPMTAAMEAWWSESNDTHFDTGGRIIIINGVRAELAALNSDAD